MSASNESALDGRAARRAAPSGPWYRRIDWLSSVWVAILLIPFAFLVREPMALLPKAVTLTAIAAFGAVYIWTVSTMRAWFELPAGASLRGQARATAPSLVALLLLASACLPVLGWWCVVFIPFVCALVTYAAPVIMGSAVTAAFCLIVIIAAALLTHDATVVSGTVGCSVSCVFILLGRIGAEAQQRHLAQESELATAREREEIGRDVHDILGHSLTVLTLKAEVAQRLVRADPAAAETELAEIITLSRQALADVRATVTRLRTPGLAGQVEASRTAFSAAAVQADIHGDARAIPLPQREVLAWALREATTNVARHAGASRVRIDLSPGRLRVVDDGVGTGGAPVGNGLAGLRERVERAGGMLSVTSPAPHPPWNVNDGARHHRGPGTELEVLL